MAVSVEDGVMYRHEDLEGYFMISDERLVHMQGSKLTFEGETMEIIETDDKFEFEATWGDHYELPKLVPEAALQPGPHFSYNDKHNWTCTNENANCVFQRVNEDGSVGLHAVRCVNVPEHCHDMVTSEYTKTLELFKAQGEAMQAKSVPELEPEEVGEASVNVFARWRPMSHEQMENGEAETLRSVELAENDTYVLSISGEKPVQKKAKSRKGKKTTTMKAYDWSGSGWTGMLDADSDNADTYAMVVEPYIANVMDGTIFSCFCYGHTESGKTHTALGYGEEQGLYYRASEQLLNMMNEHYDAAGLLLNVSFAELHLTNVYDLLADREQVFVRQSHDGHFQIRKKAVKTEEGKVRAEGLTEVPCSAPEEVAAVVADGVGLRVVGSSTMHNESSRSHAFIQMEIVTQEIIDAKRAVIEADSEKTFVGHLLADTTAEEMGKLELKNMFLHDWEGTPAPEFCKDKTWTYILTLKEGEVFNIEKIEELRVELQDKEELFAAAQANLNEVLAAAKETFPCVGGKLVFVDLAGSEHGNDKSKKAKQQTPQQKREAKEINMSLMALNTVMRAKVNNETRIPYRDSLLTRLMRQYFEVAGTTCSMVCCLSPSVMQAGKTIKTLQYAGVMAANNM